MRISCIFFSSGHEVLADLVQVSPGRICKSLRRSVIDVLLHGEISMHQECCLMSTGWIKSELYDVNLL